jgi:hypothetical protein
MVRAGLPILEKALSRTKEIQNLEVAKSDLADTHENDHLYCPPFLPDIDSLLKDIHGRFLSG